MFFAEPVAAFTNIRRALRPGARLVLMVWQDPDQNEWFTATRQALAGSSRPAATQSDLEPFSLADRTDTQAMLAAAGFAEVSFTDVHEPVHYGADTAAACDAVLGLRHARNLLAGLDAPAAEHALDRLRATVTAHASPSSVHFDSRAWVISARRP
jgi:SAM-dependent methyltransferase